MKQSLARSALAALSTLAFCAGSAFAAAPAAAPAKPADKDAAAYQHLLDAANAVVTVHSRALANARSNRTLGPERIGSGTYIAPSGLVLTIGYLILEADQVQITTSKGRTVPATVTAYDPVTGFGLLRPITPLDVKGIKLGTSSKLENLDRVLIAAGGGEESVSVATIVSQRQFAGYWEYMIEGAIFTSPPRPDHSGAALINRDGELVGVGSLFVMDAAAQGERLPGNMFVPVDLLKPILGEMIATGRQKGSMRPWLGLSSVEDDGQLRVLRVSEGGPAEAAGVEVGDIILAIGGHKVQKLEEFYRRLWNSGEPGVEVTLKLQQGADVREVHIRSIDRFDLMRKRPTI
jgi:S1-C subfamily serine protease